MARGVTELRSKYVVKLAALELFLEEFDAEEMIRALIALTEFAATHPDFGEGDNPEYEEYFFADEATDLLIALFQDEDCVDEDATGAPRAILDMQRGTLELLRKRERRRRRPIEDRSFHEAVATVRVREIADRVN